MKLKYIRAAWKAWRAKRKANTTMGIFQSRTTKDVATAGGAAGIVLAIGGINWLESRLDEGDEHDLG